LSVFFGLAHDRCGYGETPICARDRCRTTNDKPRNNTRDNNQRLLAERRDFHPQDTGAEHIRIICFLCELYILTREGAGKTLA